MVNCCWKRNAMKLVLHLFSINCLILAAQGLPGGIENHNEFALYTAIEQSLLNDTTGELFRLREVFFPSSSRKYQFWKADGLETVQFDACLNLTDVACRGTKKPNSVFSNSTTVSGGWVYQWTNSYLLSLLGTHQLYQFEPLLTSLVYLQTVGHREIVFKVKLNLTDPVLCSIKEDELEKYFTSFITWTKAYAAAQGKPTSWSVEYQGYVSRKYNTYTKGFYDTSQLQDTINFTILVCFVTTNLLVIFLLVSHGKWLYCKVCSITNGTSSVQRNTCRGVMVVVSFLLVPIYLVGLFVGHSNGVYPKYYPPCNKTITYNCEPPHSSVVYISEVTSFYSKVVTLVIALLLYVASSLLNITRSVSLSSPYILFQHRSLCLRCIETYIWWGALTGVHICTGLAGVPIIMFLIITPTYTFFFVFSLGVIVTFLSLPVVLCLHRCHPNSLSPYQTRADCRRIWSLRFIGTLIAYLLSTTLTVGLLYLYYGLLIGGASMNGTKGVLFSLLPPLLVTVLGILIRYRFVRARNASVVSQESKDADNIINSA